MLIQDGSLGGAAGVIRSLLATPRCFVISDTRVGPLYARAVAAGLGAPLLELPEGEEGKTLETVGQVVRWLVGLGIERRDGVVAVGGGVITDIAGFAAAVTLRGVPWVAVPTTLLAMVDAAVGGKTGVDVDEGKNLIGCFWSPRGVLVDPTTLATLDRRQIRSGLVEMVKAAMISPFLLEDELENRLESLAHGVLDDAAQMVALAVRVKAEVVAGDEREQGPREVLNLGHTLGHALEAATGYRLFLHGEAVAWGLLAALRLARDRGLLATEDAMRWAARLQLLGPLPPVSPVGWRSVAPFFSRDKKRSGGVTRWVLPRPGGVALGVGVPDSEVAGVYADLQRLPSGAQFTTLF